MSEENKGEGQEGQEGQPGQEGQVEKQVGGDAPAHHTVTVKGVDMVKTHADVIEAAQKHFAGEGLLDKFAQEKQKWAEDQRETLNDAQFGKVFKKAIKEKDPAALREVLVGLGVGETEAAQQVSTWESRVAGKQPTATEKGQQPNIEQVLSQMAEAVIAVGKGQDALTSRLDGLEGGFTTLNTRDLQRSETEMHEQVENAIMSDEFHGDFAGKSGRYLGRLKKDAAVILARRLQSGEKSIEKAIKDSLEEARASLEDYSDAFISDDVPLSGLPPGGSRLDAYRSKKAPESVSMTDPKYGEVLEQQIEAWLPALKKAAKNSQE